MNFTWDTCYSENFPNFRSESTINRAHDLFIPRKIPEISVVIAIIWTYDNLTLLTNKAFPTNSTKALKAKAFRIPIFIMAAAMIPFMFPWSFFLRPSSVAASVGRRENPRFRPPSLSLLPEMTTSAPSVT